MIKAEVLAKTKNSMGDELVTFMVTFPRIILAEVNTHRAFSRNTSSSRAIPFDTMVKTVMEEPFIPYYWQQHHKGMQGTTYNTGRKCASLNHNWLVARDRAVQTATKIYKMGGTKQLCNRLLEPFLYTTMIITTAKPGLFNFFFLRCPRYMYDNKVMYSLKGQPTYGSKDFMFKHRNKSTAEVHMQLLAEAMYIAYDRATAIETHYHIPFYDEELSVSNNIINSISLCAKVSYNRADTKGSKDLYDRLLKDKHMSPFEHVAIAQDDSKRYANIIGFKSMRYIIDNGEMKDIIGG